MAKRKETGLGTEAFYQKPASQQDGETVRQPTSKTASQRSGNVTQIGRYVDGPKDKQPIISLPKPWSCWMKCCPG